jgi:hypothetical protein
MVPAETATIKPVPDTAGLLSVEWLAAWFGETAEPTDLPAAASEPPTESTPAPAALLSLYPSVPIFPPTESEEPSETEELPTATPERTLSAAPIADAIPLASPAPPPAPAPATDTAPVNPAVPPPVPVDAALPAPVLAESADRTGQDTTNSSRRGNTFRSADPLPPPPSPAEPVPDRGEIIWNADLVVAEPASTPAATPSVPVQPAREPIPRPAAGPHVQPPPDPPREAATPTPPPDDSPIAPVAAPDVMSRNAGDTSDSRQSHSDNREPAPHPAATHAPAAPVPASDHPRFDIHAAPSSPPDSAAISEVAAAQPVEPARPLRPAQIATVRVDLPNASPDADTPALRLTVTQRGDQVNVQLRSWDTGAAPIEGQRMESLLNTLADQGYVDPSADSHPIDSDLTAVTDVARERSPLVESSDLSDTRQSFQNPDERRQQNQERQQQQQANFLRRQMRNSRGQSFDFHPIHSDNATVRY